MQNVGMNNLSFGAWFIPKGKAADKAIGEMTEAGLVPQIKQTKNHLVIDTSGKIKEGEKERPFKLRIEKGIISRILKDNDIITRIVNFKDYI